MPYVFRLLFLTLIFPITILASYAQESDSILKVDDIVNELSLKKKGVMPFGVKPGTTMPGLKAGMGSAEVFKEDSSYITYTVYFSNDKYDFADITFELSNGSVTDASIETYFGDKEPATKALNLLKLNFDKLYKAGQYADRILTWKYSKKGVNLWIQLTEIEFEGDNGFVIDFFTSEPDNQ